nr:hypothetical protein [uncultured Oscillibacter sp.]
MTCENRFCVYWRKDNCTLNEVRLDGMGSCEDCIVVEVPEELLEKKRAELLQRLDRRWAEIRGRG